MSIMTFDCAFYLFFLFCLSGVEGRSERENVHQIVGNWNMQYMTEALGNR